jgi:hypothetical protein
MLVLLNGGENTSKPLPIVTYMLPEVSNVRLSAKFISVPHATEVKRESWVASSANQRHDLGFGELRLDVCEFFRASDEARRLVKKIAGVRTRG